MKKYRLKKKDAENNLPDEERQDVIEKQREAVRERVKKHREHKMCDTSSQNDTESIRSQPSSLSDTVSDCYSNKRTLGKAVAKVSRAFPTSPRRKRAVLAQIVSNVDDTDRNQLVKVVASDKNNTNAHEINRIDIAIGRFFERDDISRVSPKTRDIKTYICPRTGNEILLPTRHMVLSMKEAHALFVEERKRAEEGIIYCEIVCFNFCPLHK